MPQDLQSKLLRVPQEKEFEPVGSNKLRRFDIRVVAATSRNLTSMVEGGSFRADLYYRLNAMPIHLPSLRERVADIEAIGERFIDEITSQLEIPPKELAPEALHMLCQHTWPGNVRELRNVIERACVVSTSSMIDEETLSPIFTASPPLASTRSADQLALSMNDNKRPLLMEEKVREAERGAINDALKYTRGHKTEAAKILGISRAKLYGKMKKLGL